MDLDPSCGPDVVASILDIPVSGFDAVYCSHTLEHLYPHEVPKALAEFRRVAKVAVIIVPDVEGVTASDEVLFVSPYGPITGRHILYGHEDKVADTPWMAHHIGFDKELLERTLRTAGYTRVKVNRVPNYNLIAAAG